MRYRVTAIPMLTATLKKTKIGFQDRLLLNASEKYCMQNAPFGAFCKFYFQPSLSYQLSLRSLFCLILNGKIYTGFTVHYYMNFTEMICTASGKWGHGYLSLLDFRICQPLFVVLGECS